MEAKNILKSKTFWANVIAIILIVLQAIFSITPAEISSERQVVVLAVVNIILRTVTKKPINLKPILILFVAASLMAGCATFDQTAYKTMYVTGSAYKMAMESAQDLYQQAKLSDENVTQIKELAMYFYVAYQAANDAFEIYLKTKSEQDKSKFQMALEELALKQNALIDYINRISSVKKGV